MVSKEVEWRLQKIRWNWRKDKLTSLQKAMKYHTSKDVVDHVSKYIEIEHTVLSATHERLINDDCMCLVINRDVMNVQDYLLSEVMCKKVKGSDSYLSYDYSCLGIILAYTLKQYTKAIDLMSELLLSCPISHDNFDNHPNYKVKLFSEAVMYYVISCIRMDTSFPRNLILLPVKGFKYLAEQQERVSAVRKDCNPKVLPLLIKFLAFATKLFCIGFVHSVSCFKEDCGKIHETINLVSNLALTKLYRKWYYLPCVEIGVHSMLFFWSEKLDLSEAFLKETSNNKRSLQNPKLNCDGALLSTRVEFLVSAVLLLIDNIGYHASIGKHSVFLYSQTNYYFSLAIILYSQGMVERSLSNTFLTVLRSSRDNPFILMEMGLLFMKERMINLSRNCLNFAKEHQEVSNLCRIFLTQMFLNDLCDLESAEEELSVLLSDRDISFPVKINCHLAFGIFKILEGFNTISTLKKEKLLIEASEILRKGMELDSDNGEMIFTNSLCQALLGNRSDSLAGAKRAISLLPEDPRPVHLLVLLLSSKGKYSKALRILDTALDMFKNDLNLYYLKVVLQSYLNKHEGIILTCEIVFNKCLDYSRNKLQHRILSKTLGDSTGELCPDGQKFDTRASVTEGQETLRDVGKEFSNEKADSSNDHLIYYHDEMHRKFGLISIELLHDKYPDYCKGQLEVLKSLGESHPDYIYAKELLKLKGCKELEMSNEFTASLILHPDHLRSLYLRFDYLYNKCKNLVNKGELAIEIEHCASRLVQMDSLNSYSWLCLGRALLELGSQNDAASAFEMSLSIRNNQPVLPFETVPISFMSH